MLRILAIDPSGTGTTGICSINGQKISFQHYQNQDWAVHLNFLISSIETYRPNLLLYETTNYINSKGKDMTGLLKLIGSIEGLTYTFPQIQSIESILVHQVKELKNQLFKETRKIPGLLFKFGQGWFYEKQRISLHCLDAFLVYWLWKERNA